MDLPHIRITRTLIRGITREWGWRGAQPDSRSVPGPAATGAIATGTKATSPSTTKITLTKITLTAARAAAANGGIMLRIAAMHPTAIAERRTSSAEEARV